MIAPAPLGGPAARPAVPRMPLAWGALTCALAALAVFAGALANGFAYDDLAIVQGDPRVRGFDLEGLLTRGYWPGEDVLGLWRPLTSLSFARDWLVAPDNAAWFHLVNVLGHGLVAALVFLILALLFRREAALLGGLVFALHPVHVEAVANVVGRAEILATAAGLLAALLWLWTGPRAPRDAAFRERFLVGTAGGRLHGPARLVAVPVLLGAALLAKEGAVMLPAALVLLDAAAGRWRLGSLPAYVRRNAAAFALQAGVLAAYLGARAAVLGGSLAPTRVDPALEVTTGALERILTGLQAWPHWLRLLFWPRTLLADYGPRVIDPATSATPMVLAGALILGGLVGGGVYALARGRGRTAATFLWVPVLALPVSNLLVPIGVVVAERTLYLPSLAVSLTVAGAAALVLRAGPRPRRAGAIVAAAVLALLAVRTLTRVPAWSSNDVLFATLVQQRPDNFRAHWNIARVARNRGDVELALTEFGNAIALWPRRPGLVLEAADYARMHGRLPYARRLAAHATASWPANPEGHRVLVASTLALGDTAAARSALAAGLAAVPGDSILQAMARTLGAADATGVAPEGAARTSLETTGR